MVSGFNRKLIMLFAVGLLVFTPVGPREVLAAAGDQTVTGKVVKGGFGSFVLRTGKGNDQAFNTGRITKYEPVEFRPREGDKVQVTYYNKDLRGKTIQAVSHLKLIKANPNFKEPPNPAVGTIKEAGRRAFYIYIATTRKALKFEVARGWEVIPKGWTPAVDDKVKVTYKKVPARFRAGVVYQIKTLEKM